MSDEYYLVYAAHVLASSILVLFKVCNETELCLPNNAATTTYQDCRSYELDTMVLQENEHSISDLEDDRISYSADKECSSNEGSITAGSGTQPNQTPITDCQEVPGPSTISLLDNETPAAECQELCCSISQSGPFQPNDAHTLHSLTTGGRHFMHSWYKVYPWISICKIRERAFCFYCKSARVPALSCRCMHALPT